jgi:hypothetical protein
MKSEPAGSPNPAFRRQEQTHTDLSRISDRDYLLDLVKVE